MFKYRLITTIFLAAAGFYSIYFLPVHILNLFSIIIVFGAAYEWARLIGLSRSISLLSYLVANISAIGLVYYFLLSANLRSNYLFQPIFGVACIWWIIAFLWVKNYPASTVIWNNLVVKSLMGFFLLTPLWFSVVTIFNFDNSRHLLAIFVLIVAVADIGAYLVGKFFGSHTLSVSVSPNKTWEGFWGGLISATLLVASVWFVAPMQYKYFGLPSLLILTLITVLASVVGDLTVSMVKRQMGRKNTGNLLPGHGGLLDRIDGFCAAAPVFALGTILI